MPSHAPDQPSNRQPGEGRAVKDIVSWTLSGTRHVGGHVKLGPATAPEPPTATTTANAGGAGVRPKVAEISVARSTGRVQVLEPEQASPQPEKVEPGAGVADNVMGVPRVNVAEQVPGHDIPAPVTLPCPLPASETSSVPVGSGPLPTIS
jgi:hypothetical protein